MPWSNGMSGCTVVGIAGPGDPLANPATYRVLRQINHEFPELTLCVSTNGLLLRDRLEQVLAAGVRSLTVTINAVSIKTASAVYAWVLYDGKRYEGPEAAHLLLANQWQGLFHAVRAGLVVKVNTVWIPGVNDAEIPLIAERAGSLGVHIMNILPLIPQAEFGHLKRPDHQALADDAGPMPALCFPDEPLQAMPGRRLRHPGRGQGHGAGSSDGAHRRRVRRYGVARFLFRLTNQTSVPVTPALSPAGRGIYLFSLLSGERIKVR